MRIRYERIGTHRTIETRDYKKKNDSNKYLDKIKKKYLDKLLSTYQSGFRSLHSTMTALLETTNNWSIIHIDLKKACDTVDHAMLAM